MDSAVLNSIWAAILLVSVVGVESMAYGGCSTEVPKHPVFLDTVPLGDFHIRAYEKADSSPSKRFYFAPMALLEHTSASSGRNNLTGENQLVFRVEMWTEELIYIVKEYLGNVTGLSIAENRVSILPFDKVSIRCRGCSSTRPDSHWRSFSQSPKHMEFRMVCPTAEECDRLAEQMTRHPEQFSSQLVLYFRLDRGSTSSIQRKSASITSQHIWNGPIMADLNRRFSDFSFALVTSQDRGRIVSEALENVLADVDIEHSEDAVIDPEDELRLRRILENFLFENYIIPLDDDNESAWNSLYWDYENAGWDVRPDIMARKLNKVFQNAEEIEREWIIRQITHGSTIPKKVLNEETLRALAKVFQTTTTQIFSRLRDSQRNIKWDGNQFLPKLSKLSRINLDKLRNSFKTMSNVPIKYSIVDLKLDLSVQPSMSRINFDRKPQIPKLDNEAKPKVVEKDQQREEFTLGNNDQAGNETSSPGMLQGLFQTIRGAITGGGIETAPYTVTRKEKEYEERLYPAQKWVRTQMKNISKDGASSAMFWKLFNYISGQNAKQTKIPMTAPVSVLIQPGAGPNCESTFTMAFYVPAAFQEDTPEPTEEGVSIEERPEFTVLARTYGGFSNDRVTQQEREKLYTSLSEDDKLLVEQTGPYYYAGYDPPFKLFFRRNEIWMIRKSESLLGQDNESQQETQHSSCDEEKKADD